MHEPYRPGRGLSAVNWPTTLFLIISPLAGIAGTAWWAMSGHFNGATLALFFATWAATAMGITGGYHRLFSHRAYTAKGPLRVLLMLCGGAAWEGSCLEWSRDHRRHHKYVDTDHDPYNIGQGFWWAHVLWLVYNRKEAVDPAEVPDLWADPLMRFEHRFYPWIATVTSFFIPIAVCAAWGDPWGGLFVASTLRIVANHHSTFLINSLSHIAGSQPYSDSHSARDNWFTALLTFGEGYHNYHHEFASDYRNGVRAYQWDPTKWLIWSCSVLGMATDLKRVAAEKVAAKRLEMLEKRLAEKLARRRVPLSVRAEAALEQARGQVHQALNHAARLRKEQHRILAQLRQNASAELTRALAELKEKLKQAERDLASTLAAWQVAAQGAGRAIA